MSGRLRAPWALATAIAAPLALAYFTVKPPAGDLAAATYRSELFARVGFALRDHGWYAAHGHYLPGYSLIAPALGAALGTYAVLAVSAVAACALFGLIAERVFPRGAAQMAAAWFALGFCVGLLSGRMPYDLGFAIGLGALLAFLDGRTTLAVALALLSSAASPVAGAFLALAAVAVALAGAIGRREGEGFARSGPGLALAAAALTPIVALAVVFPEGGWEPFAASAFWPAWVGVVAIAVLLPRGALSAEAHRAVHVGAALYALALAGAFAIHTPVGGNAARLGALMGAPLLAGVLWERRKDQKSEGPDRSRETRAGGAGRFGDASEASVPRIGPRFSQPTYGRLRHPRVTLLVLAPLLLYWQLETPINDVIEVSGEASLQASYYAPLRSELHRLTGGRTTIVEVPLLGSHWESVYLPGHEGIELARGWERQLDTRYGALFYEGRLTASSYREWLRANRPAYVALPDARLDFAGAAEGRLIAAGLPYLREVWRGAHWRLYEVRARHRGSTAR